MVNDGADVKQIHKSICTLNVFGFWSLRVITMEQFFFSLTTRRNARLLLLALHFINNYKNSGAVLFSTVTTTTNARLSLLVFHFTFSRTSGGAVLFFMVTTTTNAGF
jgi:hypothetical protein